MKKKTERPRRKEFEAMREEQVEINKELEKEWKLEKRQEGEEEKKRVRGYEHKLLHRAHVKDSFVRDMLKGHVRGKPTHIRRNRHGRLVEKQKTE